MPGRRSSRKNLQIAAILAVVSSIALAACGEKSEPDLSDLPPPPKPTTTSLPTTTTSGTTTTPVPPSGPTPGQTVRVYIAGLSNGKGGAVCRVLAPGAIDDLKLPKPNPQCDVAVSRSIGYHDPKGPPAFKSAKVRRTKVDKKGSRAKVTATVVTTYEQARKPSTDDDVIYLKKSRAGWLVLKPSVIFYRAVGLEPPISALKPPPGF
jgi:hypothetical protein